MRDWQVSSTASFLSSFIFCGLIASISINAACTTTHEQAIPQKNQSTQQVGEITQQSTSQPKKLESISLYVADPTVQDPAAMYPTPLMQKGSVLSVSLCGDLLDYVDVLCASDVRMLLDQTASAAEIGIDDTQRKRLQHRIEEIDWVLAWSLQHTGGQYRATFTLGPKRAEGGAVIVESAVTKYSWVIEGNTDEELLKNFQKTLVPAVYLALEKEQKQ